MHKYFRAIGFQHYRSSKELRELYHHIQSQPDWVDRFEEQGDLRIHLGKAFGPGFGVMLRGVQDERGIFQQEYAYPYFTGTTVTSENASSMQRLADRDAYCGMCEENHLGLSLIYSLQNAMEFKKSGLPCWTLPKRLAVSMAGLSTEGKILLPVAKSQAAVPADAIAAQKHNQLLDAARNGDEEAMETLTMEDIDLYARLTKRIRREDLYSIVESSFMPCGVECDQYTVIGRILSCELLANSLTGEQLWHMEIDCNELVFHVIINQADLLGEPAPGRRFKGEIWMQGKLHLR